MRIIIIATLMFCLVIGVVIAQPIRETALSAFVESLFTCASPCLFGIEPGATMLPTADDRLRAHDWVAQYRMSRGMELDSGIITWEWSAAAPDFIARKPGIMVIEAGRVTALEWSLTTPLAALCPTHPLLGVDQRPGFRGAVSFVAFYSPLFGIQVMTPRITGASSVRAAWGQAIRQKMLTIRLESALVETQTQSEHIAASYDPILRCPPPR